MPYLWLNQSFPYSSILAHRNYEQLGLKFRLFSAEILFNKGLAQIYMGRAQEGLADMEEARREKATDRHNVIDDAIQDRGEGYTVFSIVRPVECMKSFLLHNSFISQLGYFIVPPKTNLGPVRQQLHFTVSGNFLIEQLWQKKK